MNIFLNEYVDRGRSEFNKGSLLTQLKMEINFKSKYNELRTKHNLPDYSSICNEFDLHNIEEDSPVILTVLQHIQSRLSTFEKTIEELLQPDTSTVSMNEFKEFSDNERNELFAFYAELMTLDRTILEQNIERDPTKMAICINDCWNKWPDFKKHMLKIIKKMKNSWIIDNPKKTRIEYFG